MERDSDELIFRQVWADCWKSLFFYGTMLACIIFVGSFSRWFGLVLFSIFAVVTLRDILKLLYAVGLGVLVLPFTLMAAFKIGPASDSRLRGDEVYLLNANAIVVMQLFVLITYNLFLYNYFFITATN